MNLVPVIAIVGRPNVGKSTLFNQLTRTRSALVADTPGLTRDRQYGRGYHDDRPYWLIDTGGLLDNDPKFNAMIAAQTWQAVDEADIVLFVVDAREGLTLTDQLIAKAMRARNIGSRLILVLNKVDGLSVSEARSEFFELGFGDPIPIAASQGKGLDSLAQRFMQACAQEPKQPNPIRPPGIRIALVGRPNVGKSTLINRLLGEDRVIVSDQPGTTRDSIEIPFVRDNQAYYLIDTAGVRRRGRIDDRIEKFSVVKTLEAIEAADLVFVLLDTHEGITDQDLHLMGLVLEAGRGLGLVLNKWDGLTDNQKAHIKAEMDRRLAFVDFAPQQLISALHGTGVGQLWETAQAIYASLIKPMPTSELTRILLEAVKHNSPPRVQYRRIKLRYAHLGGHKPPCIVIHGNQTDKLPQSYHRYLKAVFREAYQLVGTPIRLTFNNSDNPFEGRRQRLTPRQQRTTQRHRPKGKPKPS